MNANERKFPEIEQAVEIIKQDGVISYPTESVFGLGCNPLSEVAVNKILQLKQRPVEKGLIIVASTLDQLKPYININEQQQQKILTEKTPTTWLVNKTKLTPKWISGSHQKIAVRISSHPLIIRLCEALNHPIVSTSANTSQQASALTNKQSQNYFLDNVDCYLDDENTGSGTPSQIKDIETNEIFRRAFN